MKFIDLNKNLKNKIENVYKIIGDDTFLIRQTIIYKLKDIFNKIKIYFHN